MRSPDNWSELHDGRLEKLIPIAEAAGNSTLAYFGNSELAVEAKKDSSPVTAADRHAEQLVRKKVAEFFPDDEVLGEEFETQPGTSGYRWIVDPIDGTKSFVCGVPLYSTLLALEYQDQTVAGVIFLPALKECVAAANDQGCWHRPAGKPDWKIAQVSDRKKLSEAVFLTSQVDSFEGRGAEAQYKTIEKEAWISRSWGDGYGYLLVATGRADVMVDPEVSVWDVAAIRPVIEQAGGKFTDWNGLATSRSADAVGTNGKLHKEILATLKNASAVKS
ncbi:Histidinol-phosphatase [Roseimaritima multifibrata]|uniref:Histidinol-phosphatase n=1 Tax=Roseimaritima multifibrata TaxID=1930274 RepID=A0A517MK25_9BACT|nr:histidinol-phosphatase [Roseimaritima multifibrata]QDS95242.1 Histidinol-phosphatase [Roseimaritima multifibrata]